MIKTKNANEKGFYSEWIELFWLNLVVKKRNFVEFIKVCFNYYKNISFMKEDLTLLSKYIFSSPFSISKKFLIKKGEENPYTYGETPLTTMDLISKKCEVKSSDTFYEVGCGRGRGCFWVKDFIKCNVIGIDYIPEFIERANNVVNCYKLKGIEFRLKDIREEDYSQASVIYIYGTCFDGPFIKKMIDRFTKLKSGTKIITVSYTLNDFTDKDLFAVMRRFTAPFTWGEADVYLHIKK